jgi:hypothetical protein
VELFQHISESFFPLLYSNRLSSSSPDRHGDTVFMSNSNDAGAFLIGLCLEGFFYGNTSVICALTCTLAKEVHWQLFPGLGLYSGMFAMYLQCPPNGSRTTTIIFYALCLLYVLSTVTFVVELVAYILGEVSNNSICKNIVFLSVAQTYLTESKSLQFNLTIVQTTASGCCSFLAQCILVRINHYLDSSVLFTKIFKDLPLLDRVESKHACRDRSFILGNHILRSVNQFSFNKPISIYRL